MIVITGASGFIGSVILGYFNSQGIEDIIIIDDIPNQQQYKNLLGKRYVSLQATSELLKNISEVRAVVHFGANASTLERDWDNLYKTNVASTRQWNTLCLDHNIPFIFASSAAVYGNGSGPLNHYAFSKMLSENEITGAVLRLFNVYGPNEYHKNRMASTIYHWYHQIKEHDELQIFENSHMYSRDFVWVEDVAKTVFHLVYNNYQPGIYDLGSGVSTDFEQLSNVLINTIGSGRKNYIKMPDDLSNQYQSFTRANNANLGKIGVNVGSFVDVQTGIEKYLEFLACDSYY